MNKNLCQAITQRNFPCTNIGSCDGRLCKRHNKKIYKECSICMDNMYVEEKLACGHTFCNGCIYRWKGNECPLCRSIMWYIIHRKETLLTEAAKNVAQIEYDIEDNLLISTDLFFVINFILNNTWMEVYDVYLIDILPKLVSIGMNVNPKLFKKQEIILKRIIKSTL
jgi:hypothetical protein